MPNEGALGILSGLPMEKILQLLVAQGQQRPQGQMSGPPMMQMPQMQPMAATQFTPQTPELGGYNSMGMLSKLLPFLKGGTTNSPSSVMGADGPLTVPAGSNINQMAPSIQNQLGGGFGGGLIGLLKGLF